MSEREHHVRLFRARGLGARLFCSAFESRASDSTDTRSSHHVAIGGLGRRVESHRGPLHTHLNRQRPLPRLIPRPQCGSKFVLERHRQIAELGLSPRPRRAVGYIIALGETVRQRERRLCERLFDCEPRRRERTRKGRSGDGRAAARAAARASLKRSGNA